MYSMSNWRMARSAHPAPFQPCPGHRHQSSQRNRNELALLVNLNPTDVLEEPQREILQQVSLDGHWLIVMIVQHIATNGSQVDLHLPRAQFDFQLEAYADEIIDLLFNDIIGGAEAHGVDDDSLVEMERYLEEYLPELNSAVVRTLRELFTLFSQLEPPEHCLQKNLLKYLTGYSIQGDYAGILHFDFRER